MRKLKKILFAVIPFMLLFGFLVKYNNVYAETVAQSDAAAIKNAPEGLKVSQYFEIKQPPQVKGYPFNTNSANILSDDKILSFTGSGATLGSIWNKDETSDGVNTYIQVNKKQTLSMWLYFGPGNGNDKDNSEGMALVFQNDKRGAGALGAGAQALGVYGYDKLTGYGTLANFTRFDQPTPESTANNAIQNSFAIEMDGRMNRYNGGDNFHPVRYVDGDGISSHSQYSFNMFDTFSRAESDVRANDKESYFPSSVESLNQGRGGGLGSIAFTFPGYYGSYMKSNVLFTGLTKPWVNLNFESGMVVNRMNAKDTDITAETDSRDGSMVYWHHLTVDWEPQDNGLVKISYAFNDKHIDGTDNENTENKEVLYKSVSSVIIDPKVFKLDGKDTLRWGLTGASDEGAAKKLAIFESIPAYLYADADGSVYDKTQGREIVEGDTVGSGDELDVTFDINYTSGTTGWKDFLADITDPNTSADYGLEPVEGEENVEITTPTGEKIAKTISRTLNGSGYNYDQITGLGELTSDQPNMKVTFKVKAKNSTNKSVAIKPLVGNFHNDQNIATASTPNFNVATTQPYTFTLDEHPKIENVQYKVTENFTLATVVHYDGNNHDGVEQKFSNDNSLTYNIKIDDKHWTGKTTDFTINDDGKTASYNVPIQDIIGADFWDIFKGDTNKKVTISVTDNNSMTTNSQNYEVNISQLNIEVTSTIYNLTKKKYMSEGDTVDAFDFFMSRYEIKYSGDFTWAIDRIERNYTPIGRSGVNANSTKANDFEILDSKNITTYFTNYTKGDISNKNDKPWQRYWYNSNSPQIHNEPYPPGIIIDEDNRTISIIEMDQFWTNWTGLPQKINPTELVLFGNYYSSEGTGENKKYINEGRTKFVYYSNSLNIIEMKEYTLDLEQPSEQTIVYNQAKDTSIPITLDYSGDEVVPPYDEKLFEPGDLVDIVVTAGNEEYSKRIAIEKDNIEDGDHSRAHLTFPLQEVMGEDKFWEFFKEASQQSVTVYAIDNHNIESGVDRDVSFNVLPENYANLQVSNQLNFEDINFISNDRFLQRKNNFNLSVTSYNNPWTLSVNSSSLKDSTNGNIFDGYVSYNAFNSDNNIDSADLSGSPIIIAEGGEKNNQELVNNISNNWVDDTGILLAQNNFGTTPSGIYTGSLYWSLTSSL